MRVEKAREKKWEWKSWERKQEKNWERSWEREKKWDQM